MDPFSDSRALLARAKMHYSELIDFWHSDRGEKMWSIVVEQRGRESFHYLIKLNRPLLVRMRPVMADTANNIVSSLDHIVSSAARINGHGREARTYFPWVFDDDDFKKALEKMAKFTGDEVANAIKDVWFNNGFERPHLRATKELSNSGKHWELLHSVGGVHGVMFEVQGEQKTYDIPRDAFKEMDTYEFFQSGQPIGDVPFTTVLSLTVDGLSDDLPTSPDSIFECSLRFSERLIDAVSARL